MANWGSALLFLIFALALQVAVVLLYAGISVLSWYLALRFAQWVRNARLSSFLRYLIAIVGGYGIGNLLLPLMILVFFSIFQGIHAPAIASPTLNCANSIMTGALVGFFAGLMTGRRGALIGAVAQFWLLPVSLAVMIFMNRQLIGQSAMMPLPSLIWFGLIPQSSMAGLPSWTWLGLIPAMLGGAYGARRPFWTTSDWAQGKIENWMRNVYTKKSLDKSHRPPLPAPRPQGGEGD